MLYITNCTEEAAQNPSRYRFDQAIEHKSSRYLENLGNTRNISTFCDVVYVCCLIWRWKYFGAA